MESVSREVRTAWVAVRAVVVFTVLVVVYTFLVTGLGQWWFPGQANGSVVRDAAGRIVGSQLIGQSFTDSAGNPLPQYFQSRPSAYGYDGAHSGGTNLGPDNPDLVAVIEARRTAIATFNGVPPDAVPPDALTASGSALDPDISPAYAAIQVNRVAEIRHLTTADVQSLVAAYTTPRDLGYMGEPRVNTLLLNLALDRKG